MYFSETYRYTAQLLESLLELINSNKFENSKEVLSVMDDYERYMDLDLAIAVKQLIQKLIDIHPEYSTIKKTDYRYHMNKTSLAEAAILKFKKEHRID
jgi:uncharacterized ubiquitin-like protein YukD